MHKYFDDFRFYTEYSSVMYRAADTSFTTPSALLVPDTAGPPKLSVDDF